MTIEYLVYRQSVINFIHLDVLEKEDIKIIMGKNLRRLRIDRELTQDKLGGMLKPDPVDGSHIAAIEGGKGVSDDMLARLCNALKVDLWEFSWTEKAPIIKDDREQKKLYRHREEERLGIAEEIGRYEDYQISMAKRETSISAGKEGRVSRRTAKRR